MGADLVAPRQLVRCGWAYREPEWAEDHDWHLARHKPAERPGREIRPVYLGTADSGYLWPALVSPTDRESAPPRDDDRESANSVSSGRQLHDGGEG